VIVMTVLGWVALALLLASVGAAFVWVAVTLGERAEDRWGEECPERSRQHGRRKSHAWSDAWGDVECRVCGKESYIEYGR
jgi:hypothetical protein